MVRRRDRDHEKGEDHAVQRIQIAADRDECQVDGVEHQLDAHEDDERVAPHHEADRPHREQHAAQQQEGVGGNRHQRILRIAR